MNNLIEYIKKHPMIVVAIIGGILLFYLLLRSMKRGGSAASVSPTIVPYAPSGSTGGVPGNVSTTTSTTTSSVYAPSTTQNTSSVYSPTSAYSSVNTSSNVGAVTTTTTTDSHNQQNTYNNPTYGLSTLPGGFAGVAGVNTAPQTQPITPIPVSASQARPPAIASYPPVNNAVPASLTSPLTSNQYGQPAFTGVTVLPFGFGAPPSTNPFGTVTPLVSASNDPGYKGGSGLSAGTLY